MAGKRSDPKQLAADRRAIGESLQGFMRINRVQRSQAKAKADAEAYKATGEGTMGEAFNKLKGDIERRRRVNKYGGPPEVEGAAQTGFKKNNNPV